jgi:O-antigen ligase
MRSGTLIRRAPRRAQIVAPRVGSESIERADLQPGLIHSLILTIVWLAFALSGIVFTEPAPVDALLMGLSILLPITGLVIITPGLAVYISLWCVVAAGGFLAATLSRDIATSTIFTAVSLYLYIASFVMAAFIARQPERHTMLIFNGWLVAGVLSALAGEIGYFKLIPGAYELFTKFDRAAGTFKDPNVYGPFLVVPFLYAVHLVLHRSWLGGILPLLAAGILALAVLLSFSRGAWLNLALALGVYGVLAFMTAPSALAREKIVTLVAAGVCLLSLLVIVVLQDDQIGNVLRDRATLTQSYDVGAEGRFGGQEKALRLILANPMGIGAGQFTSVYHHEEVHNVFLSVFLNNGWIGGMVYALMTGLTLWIGLQHLLFAGATRPLFLIAYAAFLATALEGVVIDSDHWRSFYILMALIWGLAAQQDRDAHGVAELSTRGER